MATRAPDGPTPDRGPDPDPGLRLGPDPARDLGLDRADAAFVRPLFAAIDDPARHDVFAAAFAPAGRFRLGNAATVVGPDAIRADIGGIFGVVAAMRHDVRAAWRDGDRVVAEATVTYTLPGGRTVAMPSLIRIELADGRIGDLFVAMDRSASHPFRGHPEAPEHAPQAAGEAVA